jgi:hypothetical protein
MPESLQHRERIREIARKACQAMLAHYGLPLRSVPVVAADPGQLHHFGVMTFAGKGLRGRLILGASSGPLTASNPAPRAAIGAWISELSNQLVGRIKNQLLLHALEIEIGTPVSVRDVHVPELTARTPPAAAWQAAGGGICIWLDLKVSRGFYMTDRPDPSRAGPRESDTILF